MRRDDGPRLATGPVSWGVDFADAPGNPAWEDVLDGARDAGYAWLELGPAGYLPEAHAPVRAALDARGLGATGSFVFEPLHDPDSRAAIRAAALRAARLVTAAGGSHLLIIDRPSAERARVAGRSDDAPRLDARAWARMSDAISDVATIAREHGLVPLVHPHAGTYIEFGDEIERLLEDDAIDLCLDTGHCAYAGLDPVALFSARADRIPYLHLKDVDGALLGRRSSFWASVSAGVFCPLGEGIVDWPGLGAALAAAGFDGVLVVEQDRLPGSGEPTRDAAASRRYIEEVFPWIGSG